MQNRPPLERLRRLPLPDILRACEGVPDRSDSHKWHTPAGVLSLTGLKFMNWTTGQGGGGAIDLVMHLHRLSFTQTVRWLNEHFPQVSSREESVSSSPPSSPLRLPPPCAATLHRVKHYLRAERALPEAVLDSLIESGALYADGRANAVFLLLGKEKQPIGAELRGTSFHPWRGLAPGSKKDLGFFSISAAHPQLTVLCESAIDALSCFVLLPQARCISTAGARSDPLWLPSLLRQGLPLYCGFDADPTGDAQAQAMITWYPQIKRLRPIAHDWNEVLKAEA
jgi:hypothetical protein